MLVSGERHQITHCVSPSTFSPAPIGNEARILLVAILTLYLYHSIVSLESHSTKPHTAQPEQRKQTHLSRVPLPANLFTSPTTNLFSHKRQHSQSLRSVLLKLSASLSLQHRKHTLPLSSAWAMQQVGFMARAFRVLPQQLQVPSLDLGSSTAVDWVVCFDTVSVGGAVLATIVVEPGSWNERT